LTLSPPPPPPRKGRDCFFFPFPQRRAEKKFALSSFPSFFFFEKKKWVSFPSPFLLGEQGKVGTLSPPFFFYHQTLRMLIKVFPPRGGNMEFTPPLSGVAILLFFPSPTKALRGFFSLFFPPVYSLVVGQGGGPPFFFSLEEGGLIRRFTPLFPSSEYEGPTHPPPPPPPPYGGSNSFFFFFFPFCTPIGTPLFPQGHQGIWGF